MAAKTKKNIRQENKSKETLLNNFSLDKIIPVKYQTLFFLILILIIFFIYFSPLYFGGKTFQSADIITSESAKTYVENHGDGYTLWNPYIFCGMPAYALAVGPKWFNMMYVGMWVVKTIFSEPFIEYTQWIIYLILLAFTVFTFMMSKTNNRSISFLTGIATSFCTGIIVFLYIGHVTKLTAIWAFPLLLMMLINFQTKIRFIDVMLTIVIIALMYLGWHVQIIFYIFFAILIYFIYFFVRSLRIKDQFLTKQLVKSALVILFSSIMGLLILSDNFTQIWEYNPYSTRGTESILEKQKAPTTQSESDFYKYATEHLYL